MSSRGGTPGTPTVNDCPLKGRPTTHDNRLSRDVYSLARNADLSTLQLP